MCYVPVESQTGTLAVGKNEDFHGGENKVPGKKNHRKKPSPFNKRCYSFKICINILNVNFL